MKTVASRRLGAGFTLVELMITVAIIAILAAIAIPAYNNYLVRSQVAEGFELAATPKAALAEYYATYGTWPTSDASAGLSAISGKYVGHVYATTRPGMILIHFDSTPPQQANAALDGLQLGLSAVVNNGVISWTCNNPNINGILPKYLPAVCR